MSPYVLMSIALLAFVSTVSSGRYDWIYNLSGYERMRDPKYRDCLRPCPKLRIVDPVCASDGRSYSQPMEVRCLAKCVKPEGEDLRIVHSGVCK